MPKYELPKFSTEELLAAFGSQVSPAGVIKAGRQGFKEGADLASTITETKGKKLKQQQEIAEIERKLAAQELLAKTVEGKPEMDRKKASLQPLAPKRAVGPETATGQVPMEPESPEYKKGMESIQAEESKRGLLATGVRAGLSPEKAIEGLYPETGRGSTFEQQTNFAIVDPATGQQKTVKGIQKSDGVYHPVTGEKVTDLSQLPLAGYKVSNRIVGRDPKTDLPIEFNDQTGGYLSGGQPYSGVVFPDLSTAPASVQASISGYRTAQDKLVMIADTYNSFDSNKPSGPLSGRFNTVSEWVGTYPKETARFMTQVRDFQNAMIKAITGAQMSEPEAKRLMGQMPTFKDNPAAFMEKLQVAAENIDIAVKQALETSKASGYALQPMRGEQASKLVSEILGTTSKITPKGEPIITQAMDRESLKARIRAKMRGQ